MKLPVLNHDSHITATIVEGERPCGTCKVCCSVMGVLELGKPYNVPCTHLNQSGCDIYPNHPHTCRVYTCLWKLGDGPESFRPDKCGFMLSFEINEGKPFLEVFEIWPKYAMGNKIQLWRVMKELVKQYRGCAIKIYPYKAEIGTDYELKDPYPKHTHNTGNTFEHCDGIYRWVKRSNI